MPTLAVQDATLTGEAVGERITLTFDDLTETVTVRELIRARVYQEVDDHNRRVRSANTDAQPFGGLVGPTAAERQLNGPRVGKVMAREVDWNAQYESACDAFERNSFLILVDERQAESLEERITLSAGSQVQFVKLTMLVGG
jgi:hypothetical protein